MYVGYNSLLQSYAIKAKRAREEGRPVIFSTADARKLATVLAAFKHFDNLATYAAADKRRPRLSWNLINNEAPVSGSNRPEYKTKHYRNSLNGFLMNLVENVDITSVSGKNEKGDTLTVDVDEFIGRDRTTEVKSEAIYVAAGDFVEQLTQKLIANKEEVVDMLAEMVDLPPQEGGFIAESDEYTYENMRKVWDAQARRQSGGTGGDEAV